jgi:Type II secretion system (T2SS), protein F
VTGAVWVPAVLVAAAVLCWAPGSRGAARRRLHAGTGSSRRDPGTSERLSGARRALVPGPVLLDLAAAVLGAGAPAAAGVRLLAEALDDHDPAAAQGLRELAVRHEAAAPGLAAAASLPPWLRRLDAALTLARDSGTAPGPLLAAAAEDERRATAAAARVAAARLGVRVVLPAGVCLLPAFVLLTVVPIVLGLLG